MTFTTVNPATGEVLQLYAGWDSDRLESALAGLSLAQANWSGVSLGDRAACLRRLADGLRAQRDGHACLMTLEMGKLIAESRGEIDRCARVCDYFADHGAQFLADEAIDTEAAASYVTHEPLGTILAIMPWNFPFWQVFRAAVPILLAGNTVLVKHAPSVMGCALAIERLFHGAGFPAGAYQNLPIGVDAVPALLADPRIQGVTLTGSVRAGRAVAQLAGANLKKAVFELGGSDPFIVLEDADLAATVEKAVAARFLNAGQSCISAKRFIVVDTIADAFVELLLGRIETLRHGDPQDAATRLAPLARADLRDTLHGQVQASLDAGAKVLAGCAPIAGPGYFYQASLLDQVRPGMPAFDEELFGPVAVVVRARDEGEAVQLANQSRFGLGGSVWTPNRARGERIVRELQCGVAFVNAMVQSDPRLPFGGCKESGLGRELSRHGILEFTNTKTVWIS
ncbi:NAD-dependent succinate-semialdehyde dehydrogenase [uncultured Thiodictyon sp.]|uniref:NAD-dependent succinate-semialdehyde dehydrogenase n=1 Tax=uncultured Thiodictyon sp. TaxID=1846217 RepID=UPI0025F3990B|nr:NAD-dependent succinate-semialdehyde dehydrogenase [uncultured Thiodictyon sp.]